MLQEPSINVIVPVRNRDIELHQLVNNLSKILYAQGIKFKFFIVFQDDVLEFNRGILINTGFLLSLEHNFSHSYLITDVDIWPLSIDTVNYKITLENNTMYHFFGRKICLGCFMMCNKLTFLKINGFSNSYNGWGCEDVDLQWRCASKNISINRDNFCHRESNNGLYRDVYREESAKNRRSKLEYARKNTFPIFKKKWLEPIINFDSSEIDQDGLSSVKEKISYRCESEPPHLIKIYTKIIK